MFSWMLRRLLRPWGGLPLVPDVVVPASWLAHPGNRNFTPLPGDRAVLASPGNRSFTALPS